jgi:hypothetical protein
MGTAWCTLIGMECECTLGLSHLIFTKTMGRKTHLLLDSEQRIIGALVGQPRDTHGWRAVHDDALAALGSAAIDDDLGFTPSKYERKGRHETFPTIAHGLSFGGGQEVGSNRVRPHCLLRVGTSI